MAWSSAKGSMVIIGPLLLLLLHQCEDRHLVHLEDVVELGGQPAQHLLELLVLFVQAPKLGSCQC